MKMSRKYLKWVNAPVWVQVGRSIGYCRKWKGVTQEEVASLAGIDLKRYKRMERTLVRDITIVEADNIAKALHVSREEIIPM